MSNRLDMSHPNKVIQNAIHAFFLTFPHLQKKCRLKEKVDLLPGCYFFDESNIELEIFTNCYCFYNYTTEEEKTYYFHKDEDGYVIETDSLREFMKEVSV